MSRRAIGDRAMTSSERQRRYLAKLAASAASARQAPRDDGSLRPRRPVATPAAWLPGYTCAARCAEPG
jgi:hypothetical protein